MKTKSWREKWDDLGTEYHGIIEPLSLSEEAEEVILAFITKTLEEEKKLGKAKLQHLENFYKNFAKTEYLRGVEEEKARHTTHMDILADRMVEVNHYLEYGCTCADEFKKLITKELATAHKEGTPTARLTSLYNKI